MVVGSGLGCQSSAFWRVFWLKAWLCGWGVWWGVVRELGWWGGEQLLQTNGHPMQAAVTLSKLARCYRLVRANGH